MTESRWQDRLPSRTFPLVVLLAIGFLFLAEPRCNAAFGINSVIGATEVAPPASLVAGATESNTPIVFAEYNGGVITTAGGLSVDHDGSAVVASPTISGNVVNPALKPSILAEGTSFNSFVFHFDPVGSPTSPVAVYVATILFDHPVIGVQLFGSGFSLQKPAGTSYTGTLEAGDAEVDANKSPNPGLSYPTGVASRGIEEDGFVLAVNGNEVMIAGSVFGGEVDHIRIFTHVPEPTTLLTWSVLAGVGLCCYRRLCQNRA